MVKAIIKNKYRYLFIIGIIVISLIVLILLKYNNPESTNMFPPCIFYKLTGIKCAGCGLTRAVHSLLNLEFNKAFVLNPLVYVYIIYLIYMGVRYIFLKRKLEKVTLDNYKYSLYVLLIMTISFMIIRNIVNI